MPLIALALYTGVLFDSTYIHFGCRPLLEGQSLFHSWVVLEHAVFFSNLIGISFWLLIKTVLSRCREKLKFKITDVRSESLSDVLSRHYWDTCMVQCAFTNLLATIFVRVKYPTEG